LQGKRYAVRIFGRKLRALREAKQLALGELAKKAGISSAFLCKVEQGKVTPPAEKKIRSLAKALDANADELMVLAGRLPADVLEVIQKHPLEYVALLRDLSTKSAHELERIRQRALRPLATGFGNPAVKPELQPAHEEKSVLAQLLGLVPENQTRQR